MKTTSTLSPTSPTFWRLKKGFDRRFRGGHPWVYSNELMGKPTGIQPGASVELQDSSGNFLARGYGNPHSLIAFRSLTRDLTCTDPYSDERFLQILKKAGSLREQTGYQDVSHRMLFGEADFVPGLILDRYLTNEAQVFVVQAHTAGAQRWVSRVEHLLSVWSDKINCPAWKPEINSAERWRRTAIVLRNDLGVRVLEGLKEEEPQVLKKSAFIELETADIRVRSASGNKPVLFRVNLLKGQKTGFFLDQYSNVELAISRTRPHLLSMQEPIRILDLCTYVGQWSTQFVQMLSFAKKKSEITLVDRSAQALELAELNVRRVGADQVRSVRGDILSDLQQFQDREFDLVISDPPALIQNRKSIPAGTHAYLQLATQALRVVKVDGWVISCSCSALLEEESFHQLLSKAALRNQRTVQWVARGGLSADHPTLSEFPEGRYLKAWMGRSGIGV